MTEAKYKDASVNQVMSLMEGISGSKRFSSRKPKPATRKRIAESYTAQYRDVFDKAENPEPIRVKLEEKKIEKPKVLKKPEPKMVKEELFLRSQDNLEIKLNAMQRQITSISNTVNTVSENTVVSGIGQGGDGQLPGGGEVRLLRLDDVDATSIVAGQSLVWNGDKFVPGSSGGGGGSSTDIRISNADIANWNAAHGWGNHADENYLKSYTETDPVYQASPAATILLTDIQGWNQSKLWGDHALGGYLKTETFDDHPASDITDTDILNWNAGTGSGGGYVAPVIFSTNEPPNKVAGMLWMDDVYNLYVYDPSGAWVQVNAIQTP